MATTRYGSTAAERWRSRQTRRLARDTETLEHRVRGFGRALERGSGPYADDARDLAKGALDLVKLAASVDGMQEITDLMTEDTR